MLLDYDEPGKTLRDVDHEDNLLSIEYLNEPQEPLSGMLRGNNH